MNMTQVSGTDPFSVILQYGINRKTTENLS